MVRDRNDVSGASAVGDVAVKPGRRLLPPIISLASDRVNGMVVLGFQEAALLDPPTLAVIPPIIGQVEVG